MIREFDNKFNGSIEMQENLATFATPWRGIAEGVELDPATIATIVTIATWVIGFLRGQPRPNVKITTMQELSADVLPMNKLKLPTEPGKYMVWDTQRFPIPEGYITVKVWFGSAFIDSVLQPKTASNRELGNNWIRFGRELDKKLGYRTPRGETPKSLVTRIGPVNTTSEFLFTCWQPPAAVRPCCQDPIQFRKNYYQAGIDTIHISPEVLAQQPAYTAAAFFSDIIKWARTYWYVPTAMISITGVLLIIPGTQKWVVPGVSKLQLGKRLLRKQYLIEPRRRFYRPYKRLERRRAKRRKQRS